MLATLLNCHVGVKDAENTLEKVVMGMLKLNVDVEIIHKATGVSVEQIEEIQKELSQS